MTDDLTGWLRDRGESMVNSGDQWAAIDGEKLLEAAHRIEELETALRKIASLGYPNALTDQIALFVWIDQNTDIARRALNTQAEEGQSQ